MADTIETRVRKDIRKYKTKIVGPLTTRQAVCVAIAAAVDIAILSIVNAFGLTMDYRAYIWVFGLVDLPILSFLLEPQGVPMERYLKFFIQNNLIAPTRRRNRTDISQSGSEKAVTEIDKKDMKKMRELAKKNPKYKPYK